MLNIRSVAAPPQRSDAPQRAGDLRAPGL